MSLVSNQIEKGWLKWVAGDGSRKWLKNQHNRKIRSKIKASPEYVPNYNRYDGWEL